jgi:hypothetical protein
MLLRRVLVPLILQHSQRLNQPLPRLDDRIHKPVVTRFLSIEYDANKM